MDTTAPAEVAGAGPRRRLRAAGLAVVFCVVISRSLRRFGLLRGHAARRIQRWFRRRRRLAGTVAQANASQDTSYGSPRENGWLRGEVVPPVILPNPDFDGPGGAPLPLPPTPGRGAPEVQPGAGWDGAWPTLFNLNDARPASSRSSSSALISAAALDVLEQPVPGPRQSVPAEAPAASRRSPMLHSLPVLRPSLVEPSPLAPRRLPSPDLGRDKRERQRQRTATVTLNPQLAPAAEAWDRDLARAPAARFSAARGPAAPLPVKRPADFGDKYDVASPEVDARMLRNVDLLYGTVAAAPAPLEIMDTAGDVGQEAKTPGAMFLQAFGQPSPRAPVSGSEREGAACTERVARAPASPWDEAAHREQEHRLAEDEVRYGGGLGFGPMTPDLSTLALQATPHPLDSPGVGTPRSQKDAAGEGFRRAGGHRDRAKPPKPTPRASRRLGHGPFADLEAKVNPPQRGGPGGVPLLTVNIAGAIEGRMASQSEEFVCFAFNWQGKVLLQEVLRTLELHRVSEAFLDGFEAAAAAVAGMVTVPAACAALDALGMPYSVHSFASPSGRQRAASDTRSTVHRRTGGKRTTPRERRGFEFRSPPQERNPLHTPPAAPSRVLPAPITLDSIASAAAPSGRRRGFSVPVIPTEPVAMHPHRMRSLFVDPAFSNGGAEGATETEEDSLSNATLGDADVCGPERLR